MNGEDGARVMIWPDSVLISCQPPSWTIRWCRRQRAILDRAQVKAAVLDLLVLLGGVGLGVERMPIVEALVVELARRVLLGEGQELALVEPLAHRLRRPRHHRQMGVADLTLENGLHALAQLRQVGADGEV